MRDLAEILGIAGAGVAVWIFNTLWMRWALHRIERWLYGPDDE